jgi:ATP-dependent Clp protease ATP-binding subunit ClpC
VGFNDGGQLTEAVRRKPYSVLLFDEIEKAHPDVFNMMLQILDDGRLTDSKGRTVDFKNTIIIMTSNVGAQGIENPSTLGFAVKEDKEARYENIKSKVNEAMKQSFRPEFLNRLDDVIIFQPLTKEEIRRIVDIMVKDLLKRINTKKMKLELSDEVKDELAKEGYSPSYGARPLRRVIQKRIEDPLCEALLSGEFVAGDLLLATLHEPEEGKKGKTIQFNKTGTVPLESFEPEETERSVATAVPVGTGSGGGGGAKPKKGREKELEA